MSLPVSPVDLTTGGALWFTDLTAPDPTWTLPVLLGLTNLMAVEVSGLPEPVQQWSPSPPHTSLSLSSSSDVFSAEAL